MSRWDVCSVFLKGIILYCQSHIKQSRSIFSIFHLLKGKRGIQTVHDAHLFRLKHLFGIYPTLSKISFEKEIEALINKEYLMHAEQENVYSLTSRAFTWLSVHQRELRLEYFNGLSHHQITDTFFDRLLLFIQTYTNIQMNFYSFIPVRDSTSITSWLKDYYKKTVNVHADEILFILYTDLDKLLKKITENEAHFFIDHLSGYKKYGMTTSQLSKKYNINIIDLPLLRTAIIHKMLTIINKDNNQFKILPALIPERVENTFITNTTMTTYNLLNAGFSPEEIKVRRNLKLNTIYDHIVEISLFDKTFNIDDYVSESAVQEIKVAISDTDSYKLKDIKEKVSGEISFFQIRLVLTRIG